MADLDYCWNICKVHSGLNYYFCYLTEISSFKRKIGNNLLIQFQLWSGVLMSIVWIFTVKFIKYLGDHKNLEIDELLDSASDYTIRIDNLPSKKYHEAELIEYINELWETR